MRRKQLLKGLKDLYAFLKFIQTEKAKAVIYCGRPMEEVTNFIELLELKAGDYVQAPNDERINYNLTPLKVYQVLEIPKDALSIFYIQDDLGEVIACLLGLPCEHLNGLTWGIYNW
jgi:hypothetical protein